MPPARYPGRPVQYGELTSGDSSFDPRCRMAGQYRWLSSRDESAVQAAKCRMCKDPYGDTAEPGSPRKRGSGVPGSRRAGLGRLRDVDGNPPVDRDYGALRRVQTCS